MSCGRIPTRLLRPLRGTRPSGSLNCISQQQRWLSSSPRLQTDGVFRALTENRVQIPWIEALRNKQKDGTDPSKPTDTPETPAERDLSPRRMSDSYHSVILPLAQDPWLLDTYLNASGHIRLGTLFMDLDALSGVVAYKHTGGDVTTVTAACDRITINSPLKEICDLEYSGMVTYATGRSSMEISLQVAKAPKAGEKVKKEDILLTCQFTMVSLDPGTKKPVNIPSILPGSMEEMKLYEQGSINSANRKRLKQTSLLKQTPNDEESDMIHALWQRQLRWHDPSDPLRKPDNVFFMDQTKLSTASIMQPQYRNRHHFMIFGGFLLKQTFELAFCCAASFAHARPTFIALDPSTFQNPVPVGSVLYMTATVVYTDPPLLDGASSSSSSSESSENAGAPKKPFTRVQVRVDTKVRDVEHGVARPTGQFNYTFTVERDIKIMPRTYTEMMMLVDASRRATSVARGVLDDGNDDGTKERVTE